MRDYTTELEILRGVEPGDTRALSDLYGMLSAALSSGETLPRELARWLGERLEELSQAMASSSKRGVDPKALASATWASSGRPGRKPRGPVEQELRRSAIWEVIYLHRHGTEGEAAMKLAGERWSLTLDQVADAFKNRHRDWPEEFPE